MEFNDLIEARRSVRKYVAAEIARGEIEAIVKDALEAPSWKNREPTRYHVVTDAVLKECLRTEALLGGNVAKAENAAAIVVVTFVKALSGFTKAPDGAVSPDNELGDMWGAYDAGLASAYFLLAAKNRGWDSLVIGIRDAAKAREILAIPEDETITAILLLGKAAAPAVKPARKDVSAVLELR